MSTHQTVLATRKKIISKVPDLDYMEDPKSDMNLRLRMKRDLVIFLGLGIFVLGFSAYWMPDKPLDKSVRIDKIVVEKSNRRLIVYSGSKLIKSYKISLGENPVGDKEYEGDKRTPEGLYFIIDKNPNSGYHKNLGISFPSSEDINQARLLGKRPGGEIKIHGLKNGYGWIGRMHLLKDWTAGCIALTNQEIDELYDAIQIGTPIEIMP